MNQPEMSVCSTFYMQIYSQLFIVWICFPKEQAITRKFQLYAVRGFLESTGFVTGGRGVRLKICFSISSKSRILTLDQQKSICVSICYLFFTFGIYTLDKISIF